MRMLACRMQRAACVPRAADIAACLPCCAKSRTGVCCAAQISETQFKAYLNRLVAAAIEAGKNRQDVHLRAFVRACL